VWVGGKFEFIIGVGLYYWIGDCDPIGDWAGIVDWKGIGSVIGWVD